MARRKSSATTSGVPRSSSKDTGCGIAAPLKYDRERDRSPVRVAKQQQPQATTTTGAVQDNTCTECETNTGPIKLRLTLVDDGSGYPGVHQYCAKCADAQRCNVCNLSFVVPLGADGTGEPDLYENTATYFFVAGADMVELAHDVCARCHACHTLNEHPISVRLNITDDGWGAEDVETYCETCVAAHRMPECHVCGQRFTATCGDGIYYNADGVEDIELAHVGCVTECDNCGELWADNDMYEQGLVEDEEDDDEEDERPTPAPTVVAAATTTTTDVAAAPTEPKWWCGKCHTECAVCERSLDGLAYGEFFQKSSSHEHIHYPAYCKRCVPADWKEDDYE